MAAIGRGAQNRNLTQEEIGDLVQKALESLALTGKRVLFIIPDGTRTIPLPMLIDFFEESLTGRSAAMDFLVALGTHQPMTDGQLSCLVGREVIAGKFGRSRIFNHEWSNPNTFIRIGTIAAAEIEQISRGKISKDVPVELNKIIFDYDHIVICGPVFPHEVVGFSGGNKYFFPGIAGPEIIHLTHWLGAVITSGKVIGTEDTPIRQVIEKASTFISVPTSCFALVVTHEGIAGCYFGNAREAWEKASALSSKTHIIFADRTYDKIISIIPAMYDDLWTAAKGMYKTETVIADGGEVILYAPHITEVSYTHGTLIDQIGYHCRDFFLSQWDQYKEIPHGVLAHSTHLKGGGSYDAATGIEQPRIQVVLATGIPEERCTKINLGYLNPKTFDPADYRNKEAEGILVVDQAGEMLYRLISHSA